MAWRGVAGAVRPEICLLGSILEERVFRSVSIVRRILLLLLHERIPPRNDWAIAERRNPSPRARVTRARRSSCYTRRLYFARNFPRAPWHNVPQNSYVVRYITSAIRAGGHVAARVPRSLSWRRLLGVARARLDLCIIRDIQFYITLISRACRKPRTTIFSHCELCENWPFASRSALGTVHCARVTRVIYNITSRNRRSWCACDINANCQRGYNRF